MYPVIIVVEGCSLSDKSSRAMSVWIEICHGKSHDWIHSFLLWTVKDCSCSQSTYEMEVFHLFHLGDKNGAMPRMDLYWSLVAYICIC